MAIGMSAPFKCPGQMQGPPRARARPNATSRLDGRARADHQRRQNDTHNHNDRTIHRNSESAESGTALRVSRVLKRVLVVSGVRCVGTPTGCLEQTLLSGLG